MSKTETPDIVVRLRALAGSEHDDLSIGDEAAEIIENFRLASQWRRMDSAPFNTRILMCFFDWVHSVWCYVPGKRENIQRATHWQPLPSPPGRE
jgi:hypothetical protein